MRELCTAHYVLYVHCTSVCGECECACVCVRVCECVRANTSYLLLEVNVPRVSASKQGPERSEKGDGDIGS